MQNELVTSQVHDGAKYYDVGLRMQLCNNFNSSTFFG